MCTQDMCLCVCGTSLCINVGFVFIKPLSALALLFILEYSLVEMVFSYQRMVIYIKETLFTAFLHQPPFIKTLQPSHSAISPLPPHITSPFSPLCFYGVLGSDFFFLPS